MIKSRGGKKAFSQGRGAAVSALTEAALGKINHNTLVIWGENDRLFSIDAGAKAVEIMPNATLLRINDAGHLPMMDQPALFNRAVVSFLKDEVDL